MLQLRGLLWQYLRRFRNSLNFTLPTPRLLLFPILTNPSASVFGPVSTGRRINTVLEAVNFILSIFPTRWPLPLTVVSATILGALTIATNSWVVYDIAADLIMNNEMIVTDQKCQANNYDYIIVGGGTAGLVVATRLANVSNEIKVLLLEAGGEPSLLNDIPALDLFLLKQPANTWSYQSLHQDHVCQNCDGRRTVTSKGKMLGGSSSINFMMYVRGNKEDFNRWAIDANDEQWSYDNVLPYFKLSEDYNGEYANDLEGMSDQYHGKGGLMNVATYSYSPGVEGFLAAGVEKGYKIGDYNGEDQEVFSKIDITTQDGLRESTYRAFYQDTGKPPNLCIKKYAYASKIHFDPNRDKIKAVAVTYRRHDIIKTVTATKEVILSAGAFGTPKLLMLSGVGPANDLMSLDIPVIQDLPVGQNLQNQPFAVVGPFLKGPALNPNRDLTVRSLGEMVASGDGPGAAPTALAGQAFFKSPFAESRSSYPDLQAVQLSLGLFGEISQAVHEFIGLREDVFNEWLYPYQNLNMDARIPIIILGRQKSSGYLSLSSKNPNDDLIIDPKYLEHPDDREAIFYGFKKVVELFENTSALNTPYFPKPIPGCEDEVFKSDEYYKCAIRHMSGALSHHVGTCALGKVVDSKLRVKGVHNLRILDASVIPRSLNGGPLAATVMIGEKGADLIIYDLVNPPDHNDDQDADAVIISDSRSAL